MDIQKLAARLAVNHPTTGLPFDADSQIASDQMNAANVDRLVPLLSTGLLAWSAGSSAGDRPRILKIKEGAAIHASESVQAIAIAADIMIQRETTVLDLNLLWLVGCCRQQTAPACTDWPRKPFRMLNSITFRLYTPDTLRRHDSSGY